MENQRIQGFQEAIEEDEKRLQINVAEVKSDG